MKRTLIAGAMALAVAGLSGCASPEPRYYSLAAGTPAAAPSPTSPSSPSTAAAQPVWIEVAPVRVPERLNRAQLVMSDANGNVRLLDQSRWSAPLPDELRDALSQQLQANLGAVDTYQQGLAEVGTIFRITTEVVRLEGEPGQRAGATIAWTVRRLPDGNVLSGRTEAEVPVSGQVEDVVGAYRQIVATTASDIATGVRSLRVQAGTAGAPGPTATTAPLPVR
ncbi:PqiC family protein [Cupriavidus sp. SZY C1]|uniref:PqiC family protein n=1 Tax=Cupriavidus sp. SZY C1 TaxID=3055037 RepID=UPI0028B337C0|nr:PqiC family protein [Cupriavidus sp. SZY C1]MDT6960756.1 PqiC family protein [Cupriavidus sp. SZY C1]